MIRNHLIVAVRVLLRQRLITAVNVLGLSAALAICVLALLYVRHEWTYNAFHQSADRIFAVLTEAEGAGLDAQRAMMLSPDLEDALRRDYPEIVRATKVQTAYPQVRLGGEWAEEWVVAVDSEFTRVFTFPLAEGQPTQAFTDPSGVVLTREAAARYFPGRSALGERLTFRFDTTDYTGYPPKQMAVEQELMVTGVLAPIPGNSSLRFSILVPAASTVARHLDSVHGVFIEVRTGINLADLGQRLAPLGAAAPQARGPGSGQSQDRTLKLVSLSELHFAEHIMGPVYGQSDRAYTYILAGIAALVLLVACINFANLTVGRTMGRIAEIGVRKTIGAAALQIVSQVLTEAFLVAAIAVGGGLALAEFLLPWFSAVVGRPLELHLFSQETLVGAALLAVGVALMAGLYPAVLASRIRPAQGLTRRRPLAVGGLLGRLLTAAQFAVSVFLVIATLVVGKQVDYMRTKHLGFDGDQVAVLAGSGVMPDELILARLQTELMQRPGGHVLSVAGAAPAPGMGMPNGQMLANGETVAPGGFYVSPEFVRALGLSLVTGRDFAPELASDWTSAVLLNESAAQRFGDQALGSTVEVPGVGPSGRLTVIGVVRDFHYDTMQHRIGPAYIRLQQPAQLFGRSGLYYWNLLARLDAANPAAGMAELRQLWSKVTLRQDAPYVRLLADYMGDRYSAEEHWGQVMRWACAFAMGIACMGLFGLAAQTAARRTKEIGIRKALGATVPSLLVWLSGDALQLVALASLVAWPLAYLTAHRWLGGFAYRTEPGLYLYLTGALIALAASLATVSYHTLRAALANPVDALRYE